MWLSSRCRCDGLGGIHMSDVTRLLDVAHYGDIGSAVGFCVCIREAVHAARVSCRPHSFFTLPAQRPARASSPLATACVHGQHPMLG
jgi:hypothetical protein